MQWTHLTQLRSVIDPGKGKVFAPDLVAVLTFIFLKHYATFNRIPLRKGKSPSRRMMCLYFSWMGDVFDCSYCQQCTNHQNDREDRPTRCLKHKHVTSKTLILWIEDTPPP